MKHAILRASILLSSLFSATSAHPMHNHRRALEIVTITSQIIQVEYVTSTVYVEENAQVAAPTSSAPMAALAMPTTSSTSAPSPPAPTTSSTLPPAPITSSTPPPAPTTVRIQAPPPPPAPVTTSTPPAISAPAPAFTAQSSTHSTQAFVAPQPSVAAAVASAPTPVAAAPVSNPPASSGSGDLHSGDGTFYSAGLGSCGITSTDSDFIVALGYKTMDLTKGANPNNNPMCGRKIRAFSDSNKEGVVCTIVDTCPGCAGAFDLDFSPSAFDKLGLESAGRIPITWKFEN